MARKKILFVIVEGPSDEDALGVILSRYYNPDVVYLHVMHCDITTRNDVSPSNVISKVAEEIKDYARRYHYMQNKSYIFKEIVHIVDMDGAYINNNNIVENPSATSLIYSETAIQTYRKAAIEERNKQKRENLNKLTTTSEIWGIPYSVYYMSSNLEHVLFNKLNCTDEEKEKLALDFANQYKNNIDDFCKYMCASNFSVTGDYRESWEFIKEGNRSLERHTNFGLCLSSK